jgi:hypothetical protein
MKITNNSVKVVNIGPEAVMPGATAEVADTWAEVSAIKCLEKMGIITVTKAKAKKAEDKTEDKVEATAEATVEAPAEATADDAEDAGIEIKSKRAKKQ